MARRRGRTSGQSSASTANDGRSHEACNHASSQAIRLAIAQPELASGFGELGIVAASSTPAVLAARIAAEQRIWEPIIRANGMRAE